MAEGAKYKLDRIRPLRVQVDPFLELLEISKQLSALPAKADGNDKLAEKLQNINKDTELQQKIGMEAGLGEVKEESNG